MSTTYNPDPPTNTTAPTSVIAAQAETGAILNA